MPRTTDSRWDGWLRFVRSWCSEGRADELHALAGRIDGPLSPARLEWIAGICLDTDHVRRADENDCATVLNRYRGVQPTDDLGRDLLRRVLAAAEARLAILQVNAAE
jgi:hypothetical protein